MIRNGLTNSNLEGKYIGHTDVPLSDDGIRQLEQLKKDYDYPDVEAVFTSPLMRCTKTASILYPDKKAIEIHDLIECSFGEFEGKSAEELKDDELFSRWLAGEKDVEPPFGESNEAFAKRITTCFIKIVDGLIKSGLASASIITHGGVIMYLMSAFALPEAQMHEWLTPNGCGYSLRITPFIWMSGKKAEAFAEIPAVPNNENDELSKWDYYPEPTDDYIDDETEWG